MVMSSCSSSGSSSWGNPCTFTSTGLLCFKVAPISSLPYTISFAVLMLGKHLRTLSVYLLPTDRQSPINQSISLIVVVNTANWGDHSVQSILGLCLTNWALIRLHVAKCRGCTAQINPFLQALWSSRSRVRWACLSGYLNSWDPAGHFDPPMSIKILIIDGVRAWGATRCIFGFFLNTRMIHIQHTPVVNHLGGRNQFISHNQVFEVLE